MATEMRVPVDDVGEVAGDWRLGLAGGLLGGVAFGALLSVTDPELLRVTIPAVYGLAPPADPILGWVVHLAHAAVLGIGFASVVEAVGLGGASAREQVGAAVGYALVAWLLLAVLAMPAWLRLVGAAASVSFPFVSASMLAAHVAYGVTVGIVYFALDAEASPVDESDAPRR